MALDQLALLVRLSEDALRSAALDASPESSDTFIARAGERASQVEQLRALDRPHGLTATALPPSTHRKQDVETAERALHAACHAILDQPSAPSDVRRVVERIAASCR